KNSNLHFSLFRIREWLEKGKGRLTVLSRFYKIRVFRKPFKGWMFQNNKTVSFNKIPFQDFTWYFRQPGQVIRWISKDHIKGLVIAFYKLQNIVLYYLNSA